MAKRKFDATLVGQLDMFSSSEIAPPRINSPVMPANDLWNDPVLAPNQVSHLRDFTNCGVEIAPPSILTSKDKAYALALADEWWTLSMVCAYLKVGRKAIWERKRDPHIAFPKSVCHGSSRPRWRSLEVRAWADQRILTD